MWSLIFHISRHLQGAKCVCRRLVGSAQLTSFSSKKLWLMSFWKSQARAAPNLTLPTPPRSQEVDRRPQPGVRGDACAAAARGADGPAVAGQGRAGVQGRAGDRAPRGRRGSLNEGKEGEERYKVWQIGTSKHSSLLLCSLFWSSLGQWSSLVLSKIGWLCTVKSKWTKLKHKRTSWPWFTHQWISCTMTLNMFQLVLFCQALDEGDREAFLFPWSSEDEDRRIYYFPFCLRATAFGAIFLGKGFCTLLCLGGMLLLMRLKTK